MNLPMRTAAALLAFTLAVPQAFAADNSPLPAGPLPAGKPADVKQAQIWADPITLIGLAAVGVIIAVAVSASNNHGNNSSTNTQ